MSRGALLACLALGVSGCVDSSGGSGDMNPRVGKPRRDAEALKDAEIDAEVIACRLNSDCPPGFYCREAICAFDCRVDRDCPRGWVCESGLCTEPMVPPPCVADQACGPPAMVCEGGACVPGCGSGGCGVDEICEATSGRCGARPFDCAEAGCPVGDRCDPSGACVPEDRCVSGGCSVREHCDEASGRCVDNCTADGCGAGQRCDLASGLCVAEDPPDCRRDGCAQGQVCDAGTGACEIAPPVNEIGSECDVAADCQSDICLGLTNGGGICSKLCCDEAECPRGDGCLYFQGVRLCVPGALLGFDFDLREGQACGGVGECQSDLCDDRCLGTCCTDADCGGRVCRWAPTFLGERPRALCDIPLGFGGTGAPCGEDPLLIQFDCLSNVCVANPEFGEPGQAPGVCGELCCTHRDCPGGFGCGLVVGPPEGNGIGNVVSACVPLLRGETPNGQNCASGEACESGHCVEAVCREPCCRDLDCPAAERCLPRSTDEGVQMRLCTAP